MLRRGTFSGYAEVDFLGMTGYIYRARWSVGRARDKENGKLQNYRMTLYNLTKEEEEQGRRSDIMDRIEELVGLTFEQFTRSILLAQNDFSTFLKADQGEKASLLEKLTGTEHYSLISKRVFEKTAEAKSAYDQVYVQIAGIELLPEEEEKSLLEKVTELTGQLQQLDRLKASKQELAEKVQVSARLIEEKKKQQRETTARQEQLVTRLLETNQQIEKEKEERIKTEETYRKLLPDIRQATELDIEIRSFIPVVEEAKKQWQQAEEIRKTTYNQISRLEIKLKQDEELLAKLRNWFHKYRDKEKVSNQIEALLIHLDEAFAVRQGLQQQEKKIEGFRKEKTNILSQLEKVNRSVQEKENFYRVLEEQLKQEEELQKAVIREELEKEAATTRAMREQLLLEQARFITEGDIRTLRDKLVETEPCPVCGSREHPYASPAVYEEANERTRQIAACTLRLGELEKQLQDYQKRQSGIEQLRRQLMQQEKELSQVKTQQADLRNKDVLLSGQLEAEQAVTLDYHARLTRSLNGTSALFGNDDWQKNWKAAPESFRSKLVEFAEGWNRKKEQIKEAEKQSEICRAEIKIKQESLQKEEAVLAQSHRNYQEKQTAYDRLLQTRKQLLNGRPAQQVEEEINLRIEQHRKQEGLLQNRSREEATQVDQTKGILSQIAKEVEETEIIWKEQTEKLQAWMEVHNVSPEGWTIEQQSEQMSKQKSECDFRLRTHAENLKRIAGLQVELDRCRDKYEKWAKLNDLVGSHDGGKFRKIAQGYTLDVLITYANVQLKNLTHRYRLERVPDTLALQVIDRDMCDEIRTVHSLSGGESFLVSLALALGLSSLSSNRMKVESLFIDEGFGSLDSDTLRVAMDALESLRTQGRKIGVISHVQEMTERIPVQIRVSRSGNGRSYLEIL